LLIISSQITGCFFVFNLVLQGFFFHFATTLLVKMRENC